MPAQKTKERNIRAEDMKSRDNIVLIGMPGAGKSTVGVVLAKRLGYHFMDSDLVIQKQYGKLLHELIDEHGVEGFWKLENDVNAAIDVQETIIATGGSAVYGEEAMQHLREIGTVIYLQLSYEEIEDRLGDLNSRGVTLHPGQTLRELYEERIPLYEKYAHITIPCDNKYLRHVVKEIAGVYEKPQEGNKD